LSSGRNLASKVVGDIIVRSEIDPACRTARHPGDPFPEGFRWRNQAAEWRKVAVYLQNHGVSVYKSLTRNG
jgi:hypothetical protein